MPFDQVREGQESRRNHLPVSGIYSSSSAGQKTEGTVEVVVVLSRSRNCNMACGISDAAISESLKLLLREQRNPRHFLNI